MRSAALDKNHYLRQWKEFANHKTIATALEIDYWPIAHTTVGKVVMKTTMIGEQYFPKKSDFTIILNNKFKEVENKLNQRARRKKTKHIEF